MLETVYKERTRFRENYCWNTHLPELLGDELVGGIILGEHPAVGVGADVIAYSDAGLARRGRKLFEDVTFAGLPRCRLADAIAAVVRGPEGEPAFVMRGDADFRGAEALGHLHGLARAVIGRVEQRRGQARGGDPIGLGVSAVPAVVRAAHPEAVVVAEGGDAEVLEHGVALRELGDHVVVHLVVDRRGGAAPATPHTKTKY